MEATLNELAQRLEKLEREVQAWRETQEERQKAFLVNKRPLTPAERGAMLMEQARRDAAYESWRLGQIFDEMGITGPPISRAEARRLYREAGFDPEATDFAQGIVAMREE